MLQKEGMRMSANDNMERVLRDIHVMIAKCPKYNNSNEQVIVDRKELLSHLDRLNHSVYEMMEQYEMTVQSRANAEREIKRRGDGIIENASAKAEDVYAAAVLYTADMLGRIQNLLDEAHGSLETMMEGFDQEIKEQKQIIRSNQTELESQLNEMHDTQKYLRLIQDVNREIQREKERKARIKAMGIRKAAAEENEDDSGIVVHTESEYFRQKQNEEEKAEQEKAEQEAVAETFDDEEPWEELPQEEPAAAPSSEEIAEESPVASEVPAQEVPVQEEPMEEEPAAEELMEEASAEEKPVEEEPVEKAPAEEKPVEEDDFDLPAIEIDEEMLLSDFPEEDEEPEKMMEDADLIFEKEFEADLESAVERDLAEDIAEDLAKSMEEETMEEAVTEEKIPPREKNIEDLLEAQLLADVEWIDSLQKK